ncbi:MAG: hypothetical protein AAFP90_22300 [Planctomycetota bacterium]
MDFDDLIPLRTKMLEIVPFGRRQPNPAGKSGSAVSEMVDVLGEIQQKELNLIQVFSACCPGSRVWCVQQCGPSLEKLAILMSACGSRGLP